MVRLKIYLLIGLVGCFTNLKAQTIDQARLLFTQQKYEEAKPIFERFVKSYPNSANYNYWYGVSAFNTGEAEKAIKPLVFANRRKVPNAALYLSKAYIQTYQFEEAETLLTGLINTEKRRKKDTSDLELLLHQAKQNTRMLRGLEQVMVIDSVVIDKINFLTALKIGKETGSFNHLIPFTKDSLEVRPTVFETERSNVRYFSKKNTSGYYQLHQQNLVGDNNWSKTETLKGLDNNDSINLSFPFVLNDGITLYFASDDANKTAGGLDILVTRFNTGSDSYLIPENIGMPFNSVYNDFLYVIDEFNNLGWFVSDRFQPEDKVCVYTFIPNKVKRTYDYENMPKDKLRQLAQLKEIKQTWTDTIAVQDALNRLELIKLYEPNEKSNQNFSFIVNDELTYNTLNDFKVEEAKTEFLKYQRMVQDLEDLQTKLLDLRNQFGEGKTDLRPAILDLEKQVDSNKSNIIKQEKQIRKLELNTK